MTPNRPRKNFLSLLGLSLAALFGGGLCFFGCASTGPSGFESKFFDTETNWYPKITVHTNIVTITNQVQETNFVPVPVIQTILQTNPFNVPVPVYQTQFVQQAVIAPKEVVTSTTNLTSETNQVAVVQLKPSATSAGAQTVGALVGDLFGVGGLVKAGIGGLMAGWLTWRNRQFKVNAAVETASTAQTVAQTFAQQIETLQEVLKSTPQGQALGPLITNYLVAHQREVGVFEQATRIVDESVNDSAARTSAESILALLRQLQSPSTAPTKA